MIKKEVEMRTNIELNENLPTSNGMEVVGVYDNLDFSQIKGIDQDEYINTVRYDVSKIKIKVAEFQDKIATGKYKPKVWGGPTILWTGEVDENGNNIYELITGYHRTIALQNENYSSGYFVVVKFVSKDGRSANYWKKIWKINENKKNTDFVQNDRSEVDVVGTVKDMITDGELEYDKNNYEDSFKSIYNTLKDMEQTEGQINQLIPKIFGALGNNAGVIYPFAKKDEWKSFQDTYADNNPDELVKAIQFESASEMDYQYRFMMKLVTEMVQNSTFDDEGNLEEIDSNYLNLTILAKVITGNSMKLDSIREAKKDFFNEMSDIMIKGAQCLKELKNKGNTKLKGAPQNKVEDTEYKKTKQLSFVFNSNKKD